VHILIIEPQTARADVLAEALAGAGHQVECLGTGGATLAALARPALPDLILAAEALPDMPVLDLLQAVEGMGLDVPVVLLGEDAAASAWVEATRLGAVDYIQAEGPERWLETLAARLQTARDRSSGRDQAQRMADALASTAAAVIIADQAGVIQSANEACVRLLGRDVARDGRESLVDLFELEDEPRVRADFLAAVRSGGEWAGEVQTRSEGGESVASIVTLSPIRRAGGRVDGLVLTLRDVSDRVAMEEALRAANRRLAEQASRDTLTSLYNRGYFHEVLEREMARALRYGDVLAVIMIDLDGFKEINDRFGHAAGDKVLIEVARLLRPHLRDGDVLARFGGDEFVALLPNTEGAAAITVAERLRLAVRARGYGPDADAKITMSGGIATSEDVSDVERSATDVLLTRADQALYSSKRGGCDQVTAWKPAIADEPGRA